MQKVQPSAGFGFSGWLKATPVAASDGDDLGTGSGRAWDGLAPGPLARTRTLSQGSIFVAGAAFRQGRVQISWQVHHFRQVKISWQARHFLTSGTDASQIPLARTRKAAHADFVAGAAFSRGQEQISWQGRHCRRVKYIFRGRGSISAGSRAYFVAGTALSQGHVHISWQVQHFRKVKCIIRGRRSTFAKSTFAAGAQKSQLLSAKVVSEVNFRSWGLKLATFKF